MSAMKPSPGAMAYLVGEALRAGGITIQQTKEKFGSIRVYVKVPNNHEARRHYREVYLTAMAACPELADNLRSSADYSEWLFPTEKELDESIARHSAQGGANALGQWDPRFKLARQLIRGEDTSDYLDGDTEIEDVTEPKHEVTISRDLFETVHAAVAWACVQSEGGGWIETYHQLSNALTASKKKE
jgi:hypothetical protein